MRRNLVRSAAAALALAPVLSACTVTLGDGTKISTGQETSATTTPAAVSTPAAPTADAATTGPANAPADPPAAQPPAPAETPTETSTPQDARPADAAPTTNAAPAASTAPRSTAGQKVDIPAGTGISELEVIDLYGARSSSSYGRAVGVFRMTNARPVRLILRLQLFNSAGKEIASQEAINTSYAVGTHHLVTSNLVKLPAHDDPTSFRVTLVRTEPMPNPTLTRVDPPTLTTKNGVPALEGGFAFTDEMRGSVDAKVACIMSDGKIYYGSETLSDNPTTSAGGTSTGRFLAPLHDARGKDLSTATCYASA